MRHKKKIKKQINKRFKWVKKNNKGLLCSLFLVIFLKGSDPSSFNSQSQQEYEEYEKVQTQPLIIDLYDNDKSEMVIQIRIKPENEEYIIETDICQPNDFLGRKSAFCGHMYDIKSSKESKQFNITDSSNVASISVEQDNRSNIKYNDLYKFIEEREDICNRTPNCMLFNLLGDDYIALSDEKYSNERNITNAECFISAIDNYNNAWITYDSNSSLRSSTIIKNLYVAWYRLGLVSATPYECYENAYFCIYFYKECCEADGVLCNMNEWKYDQGQCLSKMYETTSNLQEKQLLYDYAIDVYNDVELNSIYKEDALEEIQFLNEQHKLFLSNKK